MSLNLSTQYNPVSLPNHKRIKPSRRSRSEASPKVRAEVKTRSGGVCECCDKARSIELAHISRRWQSEEPPNPFDFADLCKLCHLFADSGKVGRKWLTDFQTKLLEEAK